MSLVLKGGEDVGVGHFPIRFIWPSKQDCLWRTLSFRWERLGFVEEKREIEASIEAAITANAANDSQAVFERLTDYAKKGMDAPETLTPYEVRQISFALSLYMSPGKKS